MEKTGSIYANAREAVETEAKAIAGLAGRIDEDFVKTVKHILTAKGRVIITGIGKSAIVAQKIVATLNSTGTPSVFMHAADAVHGDLGIIQQHDTVICISKSGNTPEIKALVPLLRQADNMLVAIVGNKASYLAAKADYVLDTTVEKEACPNDLAPTTSTTAQMVMGDALAVCLLKARNFSAKDFARFHPGGSLGKKLYLTIGELAGENARPRVSVNEDIRKTILAITQGRLGAVAVINENEIAGIITDGDIRRMLEKNSNIDQLKAKDIMADSPVCMDENTLAADAANLMADRKISQIIVLSQGNYAGMVHIHDLNREGII